MLWWPVSAKPIPKMKRDLQNKTASPNPKRDLQIHERILLKNHSYEFGDGVSNWEMPFWFWRSSSCVGNRVSFWRSRL